VGDFDVVVTHHLQTTTDNESDAITSSPQLIKWDGLARRG